CGRSSFRKAIRKNSGTGGHGTQCQGGNGSAKSKTQPASGRGGFAPAGNLPHPSGYHSALGRFASHAPDEGTSGGGGVRCPLRRLLRSAHSARRESGPRGRTRALAEGEVEARATTWAGPDATGQPGIPGA